MENEPKLTAADLEAMPDGTVVLDSLGIAVQRDSELDGWRSAGGDVPTTSEELAAYTVTVIYRPPAH